MKTWKENNLLRKFRESTDASLILRNPEAYFDSVNWTIPAEDYDKVVDNLYQMMATDSNPYQHQVGENGRTIYEICDTLASNGKNPQFRGDWENAKKMSLQMSESVGGALNLREGSFKKKLAAIALAGMIGLGALGAAPMFSNADLTRFGNDAQKFTQNVTAVMQQVENEDEATFSAYKDAFGPVMKMVKEMVNYASADTDEERTECMKGIAKYAKQISANPAAKAQFNKMLAKSGNGSLVELAKSIVVPGTGGLTAFQCAIGVNGGIRY